MEIAVRTFFFLCVSAVCFIVGCKTESPMPEATSSAFTKALKKVRAVTAVGGSTDEFRKSVQDLVAAMSGESPSEQNIAKAYMDCVAIAECLNNKGAMTLRTPANDGSVFKVGPEFGGKIYGGVLDKADELAWEQRILDVAMRNPEIVKTKLKLEQGSPGRSDYGYDVGGKKLTPLDRDEFTWLINRDAVNILLDKASRL